MGFDFFNRPVLKESYKQKLGSFVETLGNAIGKGEKISFADNDITYALTLQNKRIQDKGLSMDYTVTDRDLNEGPSILYNRKDVHYDSAVCYEAFKVNRKLTRNGRKLFADKTLNELYTTITDVTTGIHPDNEAYSCPNCGNVSTVVELQNGCPYCGTMYKMDELFPKITGYFFQEDYELNNEEFKKGEGRLRILGVIIALIYGFFLVFNDCSYFMEESFLSTPGRIREFIFQILFVLVFFSMIGMFAARVVFFTYYFVRMNIIGFKNISASGVGKNASWKFEKNMKQYCPEFSYDYFTSKAISMIKTAIYSDNAQELLFYKGEQLAPSFKDIIDMNYIGGWKLKDFSVDNGVATIKAQVYFDVLYATNGKVRKKYEKFTAVFRRRVDRPINLNFSMTKIQCPDCGSSFNAVHNKICPYCGQPYDIESQDWVLMELTK